MGIRYEWDDERQIIMNIYMEHPWTWGDFHAMMAEISELLKDSDRPYATAVDCSRMGSIPKDGNFLNILMNSERSMPPNNFASALVAAPYGVTVFINMILKIRPNPDVLTLFAPTMAEAHEKIYACYEERYPELANAPRLSEDQSN